MVGLRYVTARYGRPGWGLTIPTPVGWLVMESPALLWFLAVYLTGAHKAATVPLVLRALWQLHHIQRTLVYPLLMRTGARMPVSIMDERKLSFRNRIGEPGREGGRP
jgi:3-oxo-5-alpha-steroid 4-dehydrogenase 1